IRTEVLLYVRFVTCQACSDLRYLCSEFGQRSTTSAATMHPVKMTQIAVCINWPLESGAEIIRGVREFTLARPNWDVRYLFSFEGPAQGPRQRTQPRGAISSVGNKDLRTAFGAIRGPIVGLSLLPE